MIKHFCDICETEISEDEKLHKTTPHLILNGDFGLQIVCIDCGTKMRKIINNLKEAKGRMIK